MTRSPQALRALGMIAMTLVLAASLTVAQDKQSAPAATGQAPAAPNPALLDPQLATEQAPEQYRVKVETTAGDLVIQVTRAWAPHGADRFYNLVKIGYYQDVAFYRVISGFMAQCGFHGDPKVTAAWRAATFPDDPIVQNNQRGFVTFAMSGAPNSRTTQIFINYTDNSYLEQYGKFASFGTVIQGMETVDKLYAGYGEGAPRGNGPSQGLIAKQGNTYLKKSFPKLDYIKRMTLLD